MINTYDLYDLYEAKIEANNPYKLELSEWE